MADRRMFGLKRRPLEGCRTPSTAVEGKLFNNCVALNVEFKVPKTLLNILMLNAVRNEWGGHLISIPMLKMAQKWKRLSFAVMILLSYFLAASLLVASLTLFGLHQAREQDAEAAYATSAIEAAIDAKAKNFRSWLKGYALWDDIYTHMALANDTRWGNDNLGPGVWKTFTMPMKGIYISDTSNRTYYRYWNARHAPSLGDFKGINLSDLRAAADKTDTPIIARILYQAQPYFIGVARLRPLDRKLAKSGDPSRYLIWLQPLSGSLLQDIGKSMSIQSLRWDPKFKGRDMPTLDLFPDQDIQGRVTWTPRYPGTTMLRTRCCRASVFELSPV